MSDLNLPPRRPMPPEVRERLRERMSADPPTPARRARVRNPLAAAAAVVALAAGAVVMAQSAGEPDRTGPASSPAVDALHRCWNAIVADGKADLYPEFSTWRQVAATHDQTSVVISVMAGEKPIFCVTTELTVTVSDPVAEPRYAAGSRTAAMLATDGWIVGVADPAWNQVGLRGEDGVPTVVTARQGLFVMSHPHLIELAAFGVSKDRKTTYPAPGKDIRLPSPPAPAVRVADNPDAASARAKMFLSTCIAESKDAPTEHLWQAGALFGGYDYQTGYVLARSGDRLGACARRTSEDEYVFVDMGVVESDAVRQLLLPNFRQNTPAVLGVVPEGTTSLMFTLADGDSFGAGVTNGTYLAPLPPDSVDDEGVLIPEKRLVSAVARGPGNEVIYEGPVLGLV